VGKSLPTAANGSIAPLAPDPAAALRMIRLLSDESFDAIHLHEPLAPGPTITALTLRSAPMVGTFHAAGRSASYRFLWPALSRFVDRLDHKVVVSKDAHKLVSSHFAGEFEVLFNGVETDIISTAPVHPSPKPSILFIGRHEQRKGLGVLLEALQYLSVELECWVAGEGPDTAALQQRFGDDRRIHWLGRLSESEKLARLRGATIFCAPSLHGESFGVVLAEAMAASTVVVASSLDGYRNVATDGLDAVLVPPGLAEPLALALGDLLEDPLRRNRLIDGGRRRADGFSMAELVERYLEIYEDLVDRASGPDLPRRRWRARQPRVGT
jgi:phosphatidylinositol alpha-mannosyltransferase